MISKTGVNSILTNSYSKEAKKSDSVEKQTSVSNETKLTKVESLKQQVQSGEYKINLNLLSENIADTLL